MKQSIFFYIILVSLLSRPLLLLSNSEEEHSELNEEIDELTNNEENGKDSTVTIDEEDQDRLLKEAGLNCSALMRMSQTNLKDFCPIVWDSVMCWPATSINKTVYLPCPNYINKFNQENQVFKHCVLGSNNSSIWSLTNFSYCLQPSAGFVENLEESTIIDRHMSKILYIRICGYTISMITLTLSIMILLRKKLRCPRNFIHINLFLAFALRTLLVILLDGILRNKGTFTSTANLTTKNNNDSNAEEFFNDIEESTYVGCKILNSIFRYSGSVYHVAIFSEALYLVLLLKFPYYSEKKGFKFSILTSWLLPILWMIPWILAKVFDDNLWCWQTESDYNLLLKIPHSLLLGANIFCAAFIIRILYSKMRYRNLSREKLIKYRRLAKSILILIPIFGLHFIIFAWVPYAHSGFDISPNIELVTLYIETFFNAFQGFVVSITCCFIHRDVQYECLLLAFTILNKIKCLKSFKCLANLNSDNIRQLRYKYSENRNVHINLPGNLSQNNMKTGNFQSSQSFLKPFGNPPGGHEHIELQTPPSLNGKQDNNFFRSKNRNQSTSSSLNNNKYNNDVVGKKICCCLFGNHKNDFHHISNNKRSNGKRINSEVNFLKLNPNPETRTANKKESDITLVGRNNEFDGNESDQENTVVTFDLKPSTYETEIDSTTNNNIETSSSSYKTNINRVQEIKTERKTNDIEINEESDQEQETEIDSNMKINKI